MRLSGKGGQQAGKQASKRGMMIAIVSTVTVFQGSVSELEKKAQSGSGGKRVRSRSGQPEMGGRVTASDEAHERQVQEAAV